MTVAREFAYVADDRRAVRTGATAVRDASAVALSRNGRIRSTGSGKTTSTQVLIDDFTI